MLQIYYLRLSEMPLWVISKTTTLKDSRCLIPGAYHNTEISELSACKPKVGNILSLVGFRWRMRFETLL
jgi:hypothetical protein